MPTKSKIAKYWLYQRVKHRSYDDLSNFEKKIVAQDIGEPSCWACGYHENGKYDFQALPNEDPKKALSRAFKTWNNASFLQRCHIVPKSKGGTDNSDNLLLLCKSCHQESPDVTNPTFMKRWVIKKKSHDCDLYIRIKEMLDDPRNKGLVEHIVSNKDDFYEYACQNGGAHFGIKMKNETKVCLLESFFEDTKKV